MNKIYSKFKRKFSMSMYKNLKLNLAEMTFSKDFINDTRGDLYPIVEKSDDCTEYIKDNAYVVQKGNVKRFVCQYFPYATYEITANVADGSAGFLFMFPDCSASVKFSSDKVIYDCGNTTEEVLIHNKCAGDITLIVSCRPKAFDVYLKLYGKAEFLHTFSEEKIADSNLYSVFSNSGVAVITEGTVSVKNVCSYIDNGISIADIRPIRYENSDVMVECGKIYLTASIRMQEECFQGIFSWIPGTSQFELTGALFYDTGDGKWCGDVAASVLFDRTNDKWLLWVCSFSHGHILAHSSFDGDIRYGVNVVDVELMDRGNDSAIISDFSGFEGDEDPDFFYDKDADKWYMAICRINPEIRQYSYVFFESDNPFDGYKYIGKGYDGCETGGSFVKIEDELFFVCGNDFHKISDYRIYSKNGMKNAKFDYPDGGFRGWGTIIPVKQGSRTRYYWLTFDRHNGSSYNWSYGNLYCFEAD